MILLTGLAFCVAAIVVPWLFLQRFPLGGPYSTPADDQQTILMSGSIGLICLGGAAIFLIMAARARGRHQKRVAALRGDLSGMPLATIQPDPAQAPDVAAQPLEVMWRMSGPSVIVGRVFIVPFGLIVFIGAIGGYIYFGIAPIFVPSMQSHPLSPSEIAVSAAISCGAIAAIAGLGWYVGRMIPTLFGRPFGVRATASGIEGRTDTGARGSIAWSDIRLFEVTGAASNSSRSFSVYAPGKAVTWREYRLGFAAEYIPAGATGIELAQRQAALVNLVTAKTGLEPRTIVRSLERPPITAPTAAPPSYPPAPTMPYPPPASPIAPYPPAPESYTAGPESLPSAAWRAQPVPAVRIELPAEARQRARNRRSNAVIWVVFALCLVALACAEGVVPVTDYDWVNWVSVAALALVALNCVRLAVASVRWRQPAVAVAGPPPVAAPALDGASSAYALSYRAPARNRRRIFALGLLLGVNLIPGAIAMFQAFGAVLSINPLFNQQPPTDPTNAVINGLGGLWDFILGFALVFLGLGGIVQIVVALRLTRAPAVTLRADANGLIRLTTFKPILIPWSTIREVIWTPHGVDSAPAYYVRTDDPLQTISWPTSPTYLAPTLTPTDARPIGPDELAALVAARIGQPIRVSA